MQLVKLVDWFMDVTSVTNIEIRLIKDRMQNTKLNCLTNANKILFYQKYKRLLFISHCASRENIIYVYFIYVILTRKV